MSEPERCHCGRYMMLGDQPGIYQPKDLVHTRDGCDKPLTPAAQAVLDAGVRWENTAAGSFDELDMRLKLLQAIRRWREEQGT